MRVDRRRQGYAAAVLDEVLLERPCVRATIRTWITASLRIAERLGFTPDRIERDAKGELQYLVRGR